MSEKLGLKIIGPLMRVFKCTFQAQCFRALNVICYSTQIVVRTIYLVLSKLWQSLYEMTKHATQIKN